MLVAGPVWIHYIFRRHVARRSGGSRLRASGVSRDNCAHADEPPLSPSFETCGFAEDSFAGTCGPREARLRVHAKIKTDPGVSENREGLHLVLLASGDFREWWPANAGGLMQPREQFSFKPAEVTDEHRTRLQTVFSAQELRSVEDINTIERPPQAMTATGPLLPPLFLGAPITQAGAFPGANLSPTPPLVTNSTCNRIDEDVALETLLGVELGDCKPFTGTCKSGGVLALPRSVIDCRGTKMQRSGIWISGIWTS